MCRSRLVVAAVAVLVAVVTAAPAHASDLNVTSAQVVVAAGSPARINKYAHILASEIAARALVLWPVVNETAPAGATSGVGLRGHDVGDATADLLPPRPSACDGATTSTAVVYLDVDAVSGGGGRQEGYTIQAWSDDTHGTCVTVTGHDERGVLFGVGRVLRLANASALRGFSAPPLTYVMLPEALAMGTLVSSPDYPMRGHQLGYRDKTNAYDAWDSAFYEQHITDLAVFGTNVIELMPPVTDDKPWSPLFPASPLQQLAAVSGTCDKLGINVSMWYPLMYGNYSDPVVMAEAKASWKSVLAAMPRVDALFVPGGDPGGHSPDQTFMVAKEQAAVLRAIHPGATVWLSPQQFNSTQLVTFLDVLAQPDTATWLDGVVFGPWNHVDLPELYAKLPSRYQASVRLYPDLAHTVKAQFAVPNWDSAYAFTEGREVINPRPTQFAEVAARYANYSIGFGAYSEGANDDVNKIVWSGLFWGADESAPTGLTQTMRGAHRGDTPVVAPSHTYDEAVLNATVRDYARYFMGPHLQDALFDAYFALETDWVGSLGDAAVAAHVEATAQTLATIQAQVSLSPTVRTDRMNWRLLQAFYRGHYDRLVLLRYRGARLAQDAMMAALESAPQVGSAAAIVAARQAMAADPSVPRTDGGTSLDAALAWNVSAAVAELRVLAEGLFQAPVHMQLSVVTYAAEFTERGANLDKVLVPLNDAPFLDVALANISAMPSEAARLKALAEIVGWRDPGPWGHYDDAGNITQSEHVLVAEPWASDPAYYRTPTMDRPMPVSDHWPNTDAAGYPPLRTSWLTAARASYNGTLSLAYDDLRPDGNYSVTLVYASDAVGIKTGMVRLTTWTGAVVHDYMPVPDPMAPVTFAVPSDSISMRGDLELTCTRRATAESRDMDSCAIAEVWLRFTPGDSSK